jgi:hypothetical protein
MALMVLTGCAGAPKQKDVLNSREAFLSGRADLAAQAFENAYKSQEKKDTPYFLEKGYVERFGNQGNITKSTSLFLAADRHVEDWAAKATTDLGRSTADFLNYFFSPIGSGARYDLKGYETSMLSFNVAINHMLAGRPDLATVEARKMADREKLIERLNEKKALALEEKEREKGAGFSRVERIQGYPVEIINSPEVRNLKNSYQNAAAHYLAGFIFESQGDVGLAAPGYRLALELFPRNRLFKESLAGLDHPRGRTEDESTDVLFVVETGVAPFVYQFSNTLTFNTPNGPRIVTIRLPQISREKSAPRISGLSVGDSRVELELAADIDSMARRNLRDEMPGHVLKATTQAIVQLVAQHAAQEAMRRNKNDNQAAGIFAAIAVGAALSAGNVDTRGWTTLPGSIYLGRAKFKKGRHTVKVPTPMGDMTRTINLTRRHEVVLIRNVKSGALWATPHEAQPNKYSTKVADPIPAGRKSDAPRQAGPAPAAAQNAQVVKTENNADTFNLQTVNCSLQAGLTSLQSLFGSQDKADKPADAECK